MTPAERSGSSVAIRHAATTASPPSTTPTSPPIRRSIGAHSRPFRPVFGSRSDPRGLAASPPILAYKLGSFPLARTRAPIAPKPWGIEFNGEEPVKALVSLENEKCSVEEIHLDPPKAGELKIKMAATGVCRSDLSVISGALPLPKPIVLGHEGAGIVDTVGEGVVGFAPGDHVVLSFNPACGHCFFCDTQEPQFCNVGQPNGLMLDGTTRAHREDGSDLNVMQYLGCMAEYAVVPAISTQKIDKSIPLDKAALVGCGVMTGVGAAINTAKVTPGSTTAVFGCGGIGLSIIQGCRIAGARQIIAIDVADNKLEMARNFGATHTINGASESAVMKCKELTGGRGPDFTFEAAGVAQLMSEAHAASRRGGTTTIVGVGKLTENVPFNALMLSMEGKTVKGSYYGDTNFHHDFPMLLDLYTAGKLNLDDMVTATYSIDEAPRAFDDMEAGKNARGVILYD
jgi:S-(hydroxymethyl)glutathione dehydrogenase/alcohol dehydrogenase